MITRRALLKVLGLSVVLPSYVVAAPTESYVYLTHEDYCWKWVPGGSAPIRMKNLATSRVTLMGNGDSLALEQRFSDSPSSV